MHKSFYLIHAWDESPTSCWYPWLKAQLEAQGFAVHIPALDHEAAMKIIEDSVKKGAWV